MDQKIPKWVRITLIQAIQLLLLSGFQMSWKETFQKSGHVVIIEKFYYQQVNLLKKDKLFSSMTAGSVFSVSNYLFA